MKYYQEVHLVESDNFRPINGVCYLFVEDNKKSTLKHGTLTLHLRTDYEPYHIDNCVQDGIVRHIPDNLPAEYANIKVGDKVYTHHFLINEKNLVEINGEPMRTIQYDQIYCIIHSEGMLEMLGKWNLLEPIKEDESNFKTAGGLLLKPEIGNIERYGIIRYSNTELLDTGAKIGDKVTMRKNSEYEIEVEGKRYFRVHNDDILAVIE